MTQPHAPELAQLTDAYAASVGHTADSVMREAGAAGLAYLAYQGMAATFDAVQKHLGREAAIALLRAVEETSARRLS
jgi:hypothetical protein